MTHRISPPIITITGPDLKTDIFHSSIEPGERLITITEGLITVFQVWADHDAAVELGRAFARAAQQLEETPHGT